MNKLTITCSAWRPLRKNTLLGFASVRVIEMDLTIHDVAIHQKNDRTWAGLPARPWIKNNTLVLDDDGRPQYSPLLEFGRPEVRSAFSRAVVDAVLRFAPDAFGLAEGAA